MNCKASYCFRGAFGFFSGDGWRRSWAASRRITSVTSARSSQPIARAFSTNGFRGYRMPYSVKHWRM